MDGGGGGFDGGGPPGAPGEFGVDAGHGSMGLEAGLTGALGGAGQGGLSAGVDPADAFKAAETLRQLQEQLPAKTKPLHVPSRKQKIVALLMGGGIVAMVFAALYPAANATKLSAKVDAYTQDPRVEVVETHLNGTLGFSKSNLSVSVIDSRTGQPLKITSRSMLCGGPDGTTIRAPQNAPIFGDCTLEVAVPPGDRGDPGRVVLKIDGKAASVKGNTSFTLQ